MAIITGMECTAGHEQQKLQIPLNRHYKSKQADEIGGKKKKSTTKITGEHHWSKLSQGSTLINLWVLSSLYLLAAQSSFFKDVLKWSNTGDNQRRKKKNLQKGSKNRISKTLWFYFSYVWKGMGVGLLLRYSFKNIFHKLTKFEITYNYRYF